MSFLLREMNWSQSLTRIHFSIITKLLSMKMLTRLYQCGLKELKFNVICTANRNF